MYPPTIHNMPTPSSRPQKIAALQLLKRHGIMRLSDLMASPTLARLVNQGLVARPSRGLYELADVEMEARTGR